MLDEMSGKVLLTILMGVVLLFSYVIFIGSLDIRSFFYPSFNQLPLPSSCSPIKVYMYELSRNFHVAMIDHNKTSVPVTADNIPQWPSNSGVKRQHSVEYWMMASLLWSEKGGKMEAVRVMDPEDADAFYVPFFSSLSFNTHGKNMTDPETEKDRNLQVKLIDILQKSKYWQRSEGRNHVIPMTHPNAFRFLRQRVNSSILVVVDFGRSPESVSNLRKDVVSPYVHIVDSFMDDNVPDPYDNRPTLLFFRGNTVRKAEGKVRAKLAKVLKGYDDVSYERSSPTLKGINDSMHGMRSSKFCLHPAGDTPSSCRLFDSIVSHCVPVVVSDRIELPFEDDIDYSQFALFYSVEEAIKPDYLVTQLRKFPKDRWYQMWLQLKVVSRHFEFQYPPKKEDAVNMLWRQVKRKLPAVQLATHRSRRLKIPDWWRKKL